MDGRYITLSHRWGTGAKPFMTEKATLDARKQRICYSELPQSFQDVVTICRTLGVRYLWIDTLCIVQDCLEDWAAESSRMAEIYKNSYLTIALTDYIDYRQSILCERPKMLFCRLGTKLSHVYVRSNYLLPSTEDTSDVPKKISYEIPTLITSSILGRRAWVFQERALSCRTLFYTKSQLLFECKSAAFQESSDWHYTPFNNVPPPDNTRNLYKPYHCLPSSDSTPREFYLHWLRIVENYSTLQLTYREDKLPALSGIAREVQSCIHDTYLAGLWKGDIKRQLLWVPAEYGIHVGSSRAPSWSWAAWDGKITYTFGSDPPLASDMDMELREYAMSLSSSDTFGRLDGGSLVVRGHCATVKEFDGYTDEDNLQYRTLRLDSSDRTHGSVEIYWGNDHSFGPKRLVGSYIVLQLCRWGGAYLSPDKSEIRVELNPDTLDIQVQCLVLRRLDAGENRYMRVGTAGFSGEQEKRILWNVKELVLM